MGRVSRGASRGMDRMVPRVPGRGMFKAVLVLSIALGAVTALAPQADAAQNEPLTVCGDTIRWDTSTMYGPNTGESIIRWAYLQVAGVTDTSAIPSSEADVYWEWQDSMSGSTYLPGETYEDEKFLSGHTYTVHALDGDTDRSDSYWRGEVLRQVVKDFGLVKSSSTEAGLSAGDRTALKAVCAEGAFQDNGEGDTNEGTKPAADSKSDQPITDPDDTSDESDDTAAPEADEAGMAGAPVGGAAGLWILLALLIPLFAYALAGDRLIALVGRTNTTEGHERAV